jgi:hypothetical protein
VLILILLIVICKPRQEYDLVVDVDTSKIAKCGGLLRDTNRRYLKGFAPMIGSCDGFYVEMWRMYIDMDLAWKQKITHLI